MWIQLSLWYDTNSWSSWLQLLLQKSDMVRNWHLFVVSKTVEPLREQDAFLFCGSLVMRFEDDLVSKEIIILASGWFYGMSYSPQTSRYVTLYRTAQQSTYIVKKNRGGRMGNRGGQIWFLISTFCTLVKMPNIKGRLNQIYRTWQNGLSSFRGMDSKLDRFLVKNRHTPWKSLSSKIEHHFQKVKAGKTSQ